MLGNVGLIESPGQLLVWIWAADHERKHLQGCSGGERQWTNSCDGITSSFSLAKSIVLITCELEMQSIHSNLGIPLYPLRHNIAISSVFSPQNSINCYQVLEGPLWIQVQSELGSDQLPTTNSIRIIIPAFYLFAEVECITKWVFVKTKIFHFV